MEILEQEKTHYKDIIIIIAENKVMELCSRGPDAGERKKGDVGRGWKKRSKGERHRYSESLILVGWREQRILKDEGAGILFLRDNTEICI